MSVVALYKNVAHRLGAALRDGRLTARMRQRDVGDAIGVSQPVVSRMELGHGGAIGLDVWAAAARVVGMHLDVALVRDDEEGGEDGLWQCHRMVAAIAHRGGWSAITTIRDRTTRPDIETILTRGSGIAVVHVWDVVTGVSHGIDHLFASIERERDRNLGAAVSGLVVIPAIGPNRRRISESSEELATAFRVPGRDWFSALVNPYRPMPASSGILWSFRDCGRLRPAPALPGWIWTSVGDGSRLIRGRSGSPSV